MEEFKDIDSNIKSKFIQGSPEVPKELVDIVKNRLIAEGYIRDENKRKWYFGIFTMIGIIAVIIAYNFIPKTNLNSNKQFQESNKSKIQTSTSIPIHETLVNSPASNVPLHANHISNRSVPGTNIDIDTDNIQKPKNNLDQTEKYSNKNYLTNAKIESKNEEVIALNSQTNPSKANSSSANTENRTSNEYDTSSSNEQNINVNSVDSKHESNNTAVLSNETISVISGALTLNNDSKSESSVSVIENNLQNNKDTLIKGDSAVIQNNLNTTEPDSISNLLSKSKFVHSLEIFGGIQYTTTQKSVNSQGLKSEDDIKHTEFNMGLKWRLFFNKLSLGAGIDYSYHQSQFSTSYDTTIFGLPFSIPAHVNTEYKLINFPVLAGYLIKVNKLSFHPEAGFSICLISGAESSLTIDSTGSEFSNLEKFSMEKSYYNFVAQLSILYLIGNNVSILLQPAMNYGLSDIFTNFPHEKINTYSIRTGFRWIF